MKQRRNIVERILFAINIMLILICANGYIIMKKHPSLIPVFFAALIASNFLPLYSKERLPNARTRICRHGTKCLILFNWTVAISIVLHIIGAFYLFPGQWLQWVLSAAVCTLVEAVVFWNGIISVYCTSVQLGITHRVLGVALGWIPVANLVMLQKIVKVTGDEVSFETQKYHLNQARHDQEICKTRYPLLLVHGVFFRDTKYLDYWGRVPKELIGNGARIFYGEHQSAASVESSAAELSARIRKIVAETGCEKVNIIAHSKGGLDCRFAISAMGLSPCVASLTTINTPHRGCEFVDYLLNKAPAPVVRKVEAAYNATLKRLGDHNPDFIAAMQDLTFQRCAQLDKALEPTDGVYFQSVGSKLNGATSGKFPLNFAYHLVKYFDGDNDGLVGEKSFCFGQNHTFLKISGRRGISHGDMIDLNRENIPGFDVREFYVQLVSDLRQRGF